MGLNEYRKKRKFTTTPEPEGNSQNTAGPLTFVIQRHEASRLHYDFRLELDGVLKSWAVPKGPSLNPKDRRLAVMVEDHPMDYAAFEGIIPKGNYGAGTVMVWDKGVYSPIAFVDRENAAKVLLEQLKDGHLTFVMLGEKLQGEFALVKTKGKDADENTWLLFKAGDEYASPKDILKKDKSVLTGRSMEQIAKQAEKKEEVWYSKPNDLHLNRIPKGKMPHDVKPMLAQSIDEPFDNDEWLFEIKYDGYRVIAEAQSGAVKLYSRNGLPFNEKFHPLADALKRFPGDVVFDGEVVVVDKDGHPHFEWLQNYPEEKKGELVYYVFDLLYYDGHDLADVPLSRRKELLKKVLPPLHHITYTDHITGAGIAMFRQVHKLGIEGIMAKHMKSTYRPGYRTGQWLKIKAQKTKEITIAGFTRPNGGRKYFGALIMGEYKKGKLTYIGHVGGGFDDKTLQTIYQQLEPLVQDECPFEKKPVTNAPATWVKPKLTAEVSYSNITQEGQLRHPIFLAMKEEERYFAKDPVDKESKKITINGQNLTLTNCKKIFWPKEGYTKGDLIDYYRAIAPIILPYLKDRPESLLRYPNGIDGESFYQKNAGLLDVDWVEKTIIHSASNKKDIPYLLCQNEAALIYLINLGCIDLNPWSSRVGHLDHPDYLLLDLDPEETTFDNVVKTALAARDVLEQLDIPSYPKTSGAKGMHIYIPLGAKYTYEQSRQLAELLCIQIHNKVPEITSLKRNPKDRKGLVYLDFLQNIQGQTLASAYSVRPQPDAPVSTPLLWEEVTPRLHPTQFTIKNTMRRIQKHGDLFKGALGKGIDMKYVLDKISRTTAK